MILDYIENLDLPDEEAGQHKYAQSALARLSEGLFWIADEVEDREKYASQRAQKRNIQISLGGDDLGNPPMGRLSCAFQWYAVSAFNYAQLVGWLLSHDKRQAKIYAEMVLPNISIYRHKVAAHFAIANPFKEDNEGSKIASLMTYILYATGHFYAGAVSPKTIDGQPSSESSIKSWSITLAHRELIKRFWPMGRPNSYNSIMIGSQDSVKISIEYLTGP